MPSTVFSSLTLVTYNVWFGEFALSLRRRALLDLLRQADADVIGLQEVTPGLLAELRRADWIARDYHVAQVPVAPYGVLLLSRVPVRSIDLHPLPSAMGRHLLLADLDVPGGLAVGVVHLESLSFAATRAAQLATIFPILAAHDSAVLMGDFNLCATWDENQNLDPGYLDIWPTLYPGDPGWTEDTDVNTMRLRVAPKRTQVRFDRVILRSPAWHPAAIERLGTEPIAGRDDVFVSDHFGLRAVLRRPG